MDSNSHHLGPQLPMRVLEELLLHLLKVLVRVTLTLLRKDQEQSFPAAVQDVGVLSVELQTPDT